MNRDDLSLAADFAIAWFSTDVAGAIFVQSLTLGLLKGRVTRYAACFDYRL